jgi:ankyrin repeat protein
MRFRVGGALGGVLAVAAIVTLGAQSTVRLTEVIRAGDTARALSLLKQGASPNSQDPDGMTALHWAVRLDDVALSRALLGAGAKAGAANRYGITPLSLAAVNGSTDMVDLLLRAGADPNAASTKGETVLMEAARTGRPEPLKLLLARGADPNAAEREFGETALMWAAGRGNAEAVRVLVAGGANPNARTASIELPKAKVDFSFAVATALPRGGFTALMYAARQGQVAGATALADAGADLNAVDPEGSSALVIAIVNAHFELAARLVEKGADPNVADAAGMAALYAAVDMEHPASLTNRPPQQRSGNLSAADLVDVLLKHGADPNAALRAPLLMRQHNGGDASLGAGATPLMRAVKALDLRLVSALLENRADPSRKLANGTTTLAVALTGRGARELTPETPMFQAIGMLLDRGADVNAVTNGSTLLHQSLDRGPAFVRLLLEKGARPDLKDGSGRTPLDIALGVAPVVAASAPGRGARGGGAPGPPPAPADAATIAVLREFAAR